MTGIILAGGQSRRMGQDKGLMLFKGQCLIVCAIHALSPIVNQIMIVSANPAYEQFGYPVYADIYPNKGPIGGLYTGLCQSSTTDNIVLSCDMPLVSTALLQLLVPSPSKKNEAIYLREGEQIQPLIAYYHRNIATLVKKRIEQNQLSMKGLIASLQSQAVIVPEQYQGCLANINTPESIHALSN